jgi:hypothetical protein
MADEVKEFRVFLKDGASFVVVAHHFEFDPKNHKCVFYKSEKDIDPDIAVLWSEVRAIRPD